MKYKREYKKMKLENEMNVRDDATSFWLRYTL